MKTSKCLANTAFVLTIAALAWLPNSVLAQEKGAQKLMKIQTTEDLQKLDVGDTIIMSCPKCKESYATVVEKSFKTAKPDELKTIATHLCPSCDTKVVTTGTGKMAKDTLVHTCKTCGSQEVSCCAMKKGGATTTGMPGKM